MVKAIERSHRKVLLTLINRATSSVDKQHASSKGWPDTFARQVIAQDAATGDDGGFTTTDMTTYESSMVDRS